MIANKLQEYALKRSKFGEKSALNPRFSHKMRRNKNRSHSILKTLLATAQMEIEALLIQFAAGYF